MARDGVIQVRVDSELKQQADQLFDDLGLDTTSAIRLFLKQAVICEGLPFTIKRYRKKKKKKEEETTPPQVESSSIINDLY